MTHITALLSADHRRADRYFDAAMRAARASDWMVSEQQLSSFLRALKQHIILYPMCDQMFPESIEETLRSALAELEPSG